MPARRRKGMWAVGILLVLAVVADLGQSAYRRRTVPPEEQAAIQKMIELRRTTGGNVANMTPEQWRLMSEFQRTRRAPPPEPGPAREAELPIGVRMQKIMSQSGGKWEKVSPADREFLRKHISADVLRRLEGPSRR